MDNTLEINKEEVVVALNEVQKQYGTDENSVLALQKVTVQFKHGTLTAIMGPSGSGKSTLLQCAAGLDKPTFGTIVINGTDITTLSETKRTLLRRDKIGFIFQSFNLISALNVEENIKLPLRLAGHKSNKEEITAIVQKVGLEKRLSHLPSQLSGGQQQRVAIARALITKPAVLFADEPTGALDSTTGKEILQLLRTLVEQQKQTIIMVTHDPVAASYADRVVFLADGQIVNELPRSTSQEIASTMTNLETKKV